MKIITDTRLTDFKFWSGGKDTVDDLTYDELEYLEGVLQETLCDEQGYVTDDALNNYFWFEREEIARLLGYDDYDQLMSRDLEESFNTKSNKLRLNESNYNDFSTQRTYDEYCTDCYAEGDVPLSYTEWYYNSIKSTEIDMNDIISKKNDMVKWYKDAYRQMLYSQDGTHRFYEINDKYFILLSYEKGFDESDDDGYAICTSVRLKDDSSCIALWESINDAVNEINSVLYFIAEYEIYGTR